MDSLTDEQWQNWQCVALVDGWYGVGVKEIEQRIKDSNKPPQVTGRGMMTPGQAHKHLQAIYSKR